MNIPEPAPIDSYISENENYKRSMYLNAWHTASTQAEIGGSQYHIPRSVKIQYTNQYPNFISDFEKSCIHGDERIFDNLIYQYNVNYKFRFDWTPVMKSCWNGNYVFLEYILKKYPKINLDSKTIDGFTVLHLAFMRKHINICYLLVDSGASIFIKDNYGLFPLDYLNGYPDELEISNLVVSKYKKNFVWCKIRNFVFFIHHVKNNNQITSVFHNRDVLKHIMSFF